MTHHIITTSSKLLQPLILTAAAVGSSFHHAFLQTVSATALNLLLLWSNVNLALPLAMFLALISLTNRKFTQVMLGQWSQTGICDISIF